MASRRLVRGRRLASWLNSSEWWVETTGAISERRSVSVAAPCEVEGDEGLLRWPQDLVMAEGVDGVEVTGTPMILHGLSRELVVLGLALVAARAIDEVHDVVRAVPGDRGEELRIVALL